MSGEHRWEIAHIQPTYVKHLNDTSVSRKPLLLCLYSTPPAGAAATGEDAIGALAGAPEMGAAAGGSTTVVGEATGGFSVATGAWTGACSTADERRSVRGRPVEEITLSGC